jgi:hypothetical protein
MAKFNVLHRRQLAHAKRVARAAMKAKVASKSDAELEAAANTPIGMRLAAMSDEELHRIVETGRLPAPKP